MPKRDGTMYLWEKAELNQAKRRYEAAVNHVKMHPSSARIYEAEEKLAFANLLRVSTKYAGCK